MAKPLAKQLQLRRILERSMENFKKIGRANLTPGKVRSRLSILKDTWTQFLDGDVILSKVIPEASYRLFQ